MGHYTKLLQLSPEKLAIENRQTLFSRFFRDSSETGNDSIIDIDKSREGILFLLKGSSESVNQEETYEKLFNGAVIDFPMEEGDEVVYHVLTPEEVREIKDSLIGVDITTLYKNYDPLVMMASGVYPDIWSYGKESYDYLHSYFIGLRNFIDKAAQESKAVVVVTT
ncbi:DUF1877 family protein [Taibaiella chishuiensis]|uniref:Uncharacterized protein DUF1877 n=1 Tax=Taibaiella chishuiensis TaxID=1434707 RepID=A0A2P8D0Q2_9BACT|nr:DUF1877 family protein [Taibaiella chishuiensis]PSK90801.1 uncharacterized protein DUF1877 [Taibaiella chishuiensis]